MRPRPSSEPTIVMILAQDLSHLRGHWLDAFVRSFALTWCLGFALMLLVALQARGWLQHHISNSSTRTCAR